MYAPVFSQKGIDCSKTSLCPAPIETTSVPGGCKAGKPFAFPRQGKPRKYTLSFRAQRGIPPMAACPCLPPPGEGGAATPRRMRGCSIYHLIRLTAFGSFPSRGSQVICSVILSAGSNPLWGCFSGGSFVAELLRMTPSLCHSERRVESPMGLHIRGILRRCPPQDDTVSLSF